MQETDDSQPEPKKMGRPREGHKMRQTSLALTDGDTELIQFIQRALGAGTTQADAIRSSVRAYAMHLERVLGK